MAYKEVFGAIPNKVDIRDYVASVSAPVILPEEFELEMCPVKNQGAVNSCVAHSISSVIEYFNKIQEGSYIEMSVGYIYGNRIGMDYNGTGMYMNDALNNTVKYGDVPNSKFNYNVEVPEIITKFNSRAFELSPDAIPNRFSSYFRLETAQSIKVNLIQNGPVIFYIPWYTDMVVSGDILQHNPKVEDTKGYHAMVIYGWDKRGWKIQNSWGTTWADGGRAILPFDFKIMDAYGIIDTITSKGNNQRIMQLEKEIQNKLSEIDVLNQLLDETNKKYEQKEKQLQDAQNLLNKIQEQLNESNELVDVLTKNKQALTVQIGTLTKTCQDLRATYEANRAALDKCTETIEDQKKTIDVLEQEILEIKKPYENWNNVIVNIINWIINLFKKKK